MAKYEDFTEEYQRTLCDIESNFQENLNTFYNNNCNQEARRKYRAQSFDDVGYTFADHQILLKNIKLNTQPKFELVDLAVSYKNMVLDVEFKVNDLELSGDYSLISDLKDNKCTQGKISFEVKNIKFKGKIGIFIEGDSFMATNYNLDFSLDHTETPQLIKDTPVFPLLEISLKSHLNKHVLFRIVSEIVEFSVCEMFNDEPEHLLYRNYVNARAKQANDYFESTYKKFIVACNHLKTIAKPFTIIIDSDDLKSVEVSAIALQNISGIERQNSTSLYQSETEEIYYIAVDLSNVKYAFTCKFNYANSSEDRTLLVTFYYNTVMFNVKKLEGDKWDVTLNIEELKNLDMEENELEISDSAKETVGAFLAGHARHFTNEVLQNIAGNLNN